MPLIKTISVTYERKINLGNYESATVGCTIWADVDAEENAQQAIDECFSQAKQTVKQQALPLIKADPGSLQFKESFLGKPIETKGN